MKKLLIITLGTFLFTTAQSQVYVQGGLNLANISNANSGSVNKNNTLATFNAGILARSNSSGILAVESGLLLDGRGAKVEGGSGNTNYKVTFNPLYLELPVNLVVRVPIGSDANLFINGGPYIAMGIAGKSKSEGQLGGISGSQTQNIKFTSADPNADDQAYSKLKRYDYGLNIGAGVDLKKILLKVNYGYGMAKINSMQTDNGENDKDKYRTLSVSLGIPLNR
ncbi:MAG: porin family protein [Ginsengibacter sp.]